MSFFNGTYDNLKITSDYLLEDFLFNAPAVIQDTNMEDNVYNYVFRQVVEHIMHMNIEYRNDPDGLLDFIELNENDEIEKFKRIQAKQAIWLLAGGGDGGISKEVNNLLTVYGFININYIQKGV
jgi:hypothetical protein